MAKINKINKSTNYLSLLFIQIVNLYLDLTIVRLIKVKSVQETYLIKHSNKIDKTNKDNEK